jgi:hypothetical protein
MYLGPQIVKIGPEGAVAECAKAPTRYQRYSCIHGLGHAYMRLFDESLHYALRWCRALGAAYAVDCAQGAYHDYWIALSGRDETRRPAHARSSVRALCDSQPRVFVRACWYRALVEHPPRHALRSAHDLLALCAGLDGLAHGACITAASVAADTDDPFHQLAVCARLAGHAAVDCVRGVRVWSLAGSPLWFQVSLVRRCSGFRPGAQFGCYSWLGKTFNVVRNGSFGFRGCTRLPRGRSRSACLSGARSYRGPLETFS